MNVDDLAAVMASLGAKMEPKEEWRLVEVGVATSLSDPTLVYFPCFLAAIKELEPFKKQFHCDHPPDTLILDGLTVVGGVPLLRHAHFIHFCHEIDALQDLRPHLTPSNVFEIIKGARMFHFTAAADLCEMYLIANVSREDAVPLLNCSSVLLSSKMQSWCLDFAAYHFHTIFDGDLLPKLTSKAAVALFKHPRLRVAGEDDFFEGILNWYHNNWGKEKEKRHVMKLSLRHVGAKWLSADNFKEYLQLVNRSKSSPEESLVSKYRHWPKIFVDTVGGCSHIGNQMLETPSPEETCSKKRNVSFRPTVKDVYSGLDLSHMLPAPPMECIALRGNGEKLICVTKDSGECTVCACADHFADATDCQSVFLLDLTKSDLIWRKTAIRFEKTCEAEISPQLIKDHIQICGDFVFFKSVFIGFGAAILGYDLESGARVFTGPIGLLRLYADIDELCMIPVGREAFLLDGLSGKVYRYHDSLKRWTVQLNLFEITNRQISGHPSFKTHFIESQDIIFVAHFDTNDLVDIFLITLWRG